MHASLAWNRTMAIPMTEFPFVSVATLLRRTARDRSKPRSLGAKLQKHIKLRAQHAWNECQQAQHRSLVKQFVLFSTYLFICAIRIVYNPIMTECHPSAGISLYATGMQKLKLITF
jgi:hypothetical protein